MSGFFSNSSGEKYIEGMDLSGWDVSKVTNCDDFFGGITIGQNLKNQTLQTVIQIRHIFSFSSVLIFVK